MEQFAELMLGEFGRLNDKMESGFAQIHAKLAEHDDRFSEIDHRFIEIDTRFSKIDQRFSEMDNRFVGIEHCIKSIESIQENILDELKPLARAFDHDTQMLHNHENRIVRLEDVCAK